MTDSAMEQKQMQDLLCDFEGEVLVGGLGLGVCIAYLDCLPKVGCVTVVEREQDVIDMVQPYLPEGVDVVHGDLHDFLGNANYADAYHKLFFDTWASDGEATFHQQVVPLRLAALENGYADHWDDIVCWNEDVMRGQLEQALSSRAAMLSGTYPGDSCIDWEDVLTKVDPAEYHSMFVNWAIPFFEWLHMSEVKPEDIGAYTEAYVENYGRPGWEDKWIKVALQVAAQEVSTDPHGCGVRGHRNHARYDGGSQLDRRRAGHVAGDRAGRA
jgi:hypothetical protein